MARDSTAAAWTHVIKIGIIVEDFNDTRIQNNL